MAALNLTIDNAPTRPRERAREDLTIVIIIVVAIPNITKFLENSNLLDKVDANFM